MHLHSICWVWQPVTPSSRPGQFRITSGCFVHTAPMHQKRVGSPSDFSGPRRRAHAIPCIRYYRPAPAAIVLARSQANAFGKALVAHRQLGRLPAQSANAAHGGKKCNRPRIERKVWQRRGQASLCASKQWDWKRSVFSRGRRRRRGTVGVFGADLIRRAGAGVERGLRGQAWRKTGEGLGRLARTTVDLVFTRNTRTMAGDREAQGHQERIRQPVGGSQHGSRTEGA